MLNDFFQLFISPDVHKKSGMVSWSKNDLNVFFLDYFPPTLFNHSKQNAP